MWLAFFITQIIEIPIFSFLNRREPIRSNIFSIALTNTLTWPIATILWNYTSISLFLLELGIILLETFIFSFIFGLDTKKAFVFAIVINSISAGFGFLIHQYSNGKTFQILFFINLPWHSTWVKRFFGRIFFGLFFQESTF